MHRMTRARLKMPISWNFKPFLANSEFGFEKLSKLTPNDVEAMASNV